MEGKFEHVNFSSASGLVAASFHQHGFSFGSQRGRHDEGGTLGSSTVLVLAWWEGLDTSVSQALWGCVPVLGQGG